ARNRRRSGRAAGARARHPPTDRFHRATVRATRLPAGGREATGPPRLQRLPRTRPARPRRTASSAENADGQPRLPRRRPRRADLMRRCQGHIPWSSVDSRLGALREIGIATASPRGRPDAVPGWFWWDGSAVYFTCAARARKVRNIANEPEVVLHN